MKQTSTRYTEWYKDKNVVSATYFSRSTEQVICTEHSVSDMKVTIQATWTSVIIYSPAWIKSVMTTKYDISQNHSSSSIQHNNRADNLIVINVAQIISVLHLVSYGSFLWGTNVVIKHNLLLLISVWCWFCAPCWIVVSATSSYCLLDW